MNEPGDGRNIILFGPPGVGKGAQATILSHLSRIATVVTDAGIEDRDAKMLEDAGVKLVVAAAASATQDKQARQG